MKFGPVPVAEAEGAVLAHSQSAARPDGTPYRLAKGTRLTAAHRRDLAAMGLTEVTVALLDADDVPEDEAAKRLAEALLGTAGDPLLEATVPKTGRVNLRATAAGVVGLSAECINAANLINPGITIATVAPFAKLGAGNLAATIKIIPYAVPKAALDQACDAARRAIMLHGPQVQRASLIETLVEGTTPSDKGRQVTQARLAHFGVELTERTLVPHTIPALSEALNAAVGEILLILTASATSDSGDTAPEALRQAGGTVDHYGMPVDPGNLLFLGQLGEKPVIGLPGCARSPALNGADWVLDRILCGVPVTAQDIMGMGVGGLLKEIPQRPRPRES